MEKQSLERTGKTVDEAIELAILELGVGRDEVEVDVVSRGRAGILGIGAEPARVRVSLITGSAAGAGTALGVVNHLLSAMDVDAKPTIRSSGTGPDDPAIIDIQGEDAGLIIGRRGETLRALQYVVNIILNRRDEHTGIIVDVEQYRERRQRQLRQIATRMAERAVSSGQPVTLDPMTPADRRIVHVTLAEDRGVTTQSSGEGSERRVTITPTGQRGPRPASPRPPQGGRRRRPGGGGPNRRPAMRDDRD
jgi:spoIIIJ-associated protein